MASTTLLDESSLRSWFSHIGEAGISRTNGDISELPDDILSSILSLFPMREAVKARSLSSRWRYLYPSPFNLDFSINSANSGNFKSMFLREVNHILEQCEKTIPKVDSFKLHYCLGNEDACHIDKWITFAVTMKIEKLDLNFSSIHKISSIRKGSELYSFPCHLLCKAPYLKHLRLEECTLRSSTESTTTCSLLKSLENIELQSVDLDQSALDTILSGCTNLRFLRLKSCELPRKLSIRGPFHCLNLLALSSCHGPDTLEILSIDRVVKFEYFGLRNLNLVGVSLFEKTQITCASDDHIRFGKDLPQLESLSLLLLTLRTPAIPVKADMVSRLKELELIVHLTKMFDLLSLAPILNVCLNLRKFRLEIRGGKKYFEDGPLVRWRYKKKQNICPLLKEVEVSGFSNEFCNASDFVLYLIRGAVGIERMSVRMRRWGAVTAKEIQRLREEEQMAEHVLSKEKMAINPNLQLSFG